MRFSSIEALHYILPEQACLLLSFVYSRQKERMILRMLDETRHARVSGNKIDRM